jgi:hypothetical protein
LLSRLFVEKSRWKIPEKDPKNPKDSDFFYKKVNMWKEHYSNNPKDKKRLKE